LTPGTVWREYEFKAKPGDPRRRPPQIAPYHLRLDWLMWFAAMSPAYAESWLVPLVMKLLENDRPTLQLLGPNPFRDRPPSHIRAVLYRYRFATWAERRNSSEWWVRRRLGLYLPPVRARAHSVTQAPPAFDD
jgi:Lipase maturation factor